MFENPIVQALADRVRRDGSAPLLTWYRPESGGRTELSVRTFANWVDKTANLLDDLGVEGRVAGPVSVAHPGHWMSVLWPLAAWQHGCGYLAGEPDADCELVVVGPADPRPYPGLTTIACSLHPLGLGLAGLPDGVLDFSTEALAQPDAHASAPAPAGAPIWIDADHTLTADALDPASGSRTVSDRVRSGRVLVRPGNAWDTLVAAVLGPVLGGGSAVVVEGPVDADRLARIAASERVEGGMA
ncbi:MAG: TIGR03089 family protein [Propionicimonas sp.]|uniref:TIGR03089 family protein n=1 Tax=Propionicimonas sp. TaxID=1955623 RepID=UPI003D0D09E1